MSVEAWRAAGAFHAIGGHQVFVRDEPAADAAAALPPLLVLHGFPTNSYDFASVLDALAAQRRVVLPDFVGFGLSDKPDHRYGDPRRRRHHRGRGRRRSGSTEVDLLSHDMGDSVAGELLARDLDGELGLLGAPPGAHQRVDLPRPGAAHHRPAAAAVAARRGGADLRRGALHREPGGHLRARAPPVRRGAGRPVAAAHPQRRRLACSPARSATSRTAGPRSAATRAPSRRTRRRSASCGASSTRSPSTP